MPGGGGSGTQKSTGLNCPGKRLVSTRETRHNKSLMKRYFFHNLSIRYHNNIAKQKILALIIKNENEVYTIKRLHNILRNINNKALFYANAICKYANTWHKLKTYLLNSWRDISSIAYDSLFISILSPTSNHKCVPIDNKVHISAESIDAICAEYEAVLPKVRAHYEQSRPSLAKVVGSIGIAVLSFFGGVNKPVSISPPTAYAQEQRHIPPELAGDKRFDYFDGGVYTKETFPKDHPKNNKVLRRTEPDDLSQVFLQGNPLYTFIGKPLLFLNANNKVLSISFDDNNPNDIIITFEYNNVRYAGFKKINPDILRLIQKMDL